MKVIRTDERIKNRTTFGKLNPGDSFIWFDDDELMVKLKPCVYVSFNSAVRLKDGQFETGISEWEPVIMVNAEIRYHL